MEKYTIEHEGHIIPFFIQRKNVKNINLRVYNDATVVVSAHAQVPYAFIESFIYQKASWIIKNIRRFDQKNRQARDRSYVSGEIFEYLGRPCRLTVSRTSEKDKVIFREEEIYILTSDVEDSTKKAQLLNSWYKAQAEAVFQDSLDRMLELLNRFVELERPKLTVRFMKTRWGSCSWNKQKITLNTRLIEYPLECIDYVVLHELVHFKYQRHDKKFYEFMSALMPDWKDRRKALKRNR